MLFSSNRKINKFMTLWMTGDLPDDADAVADYETNIQNGGHFQFFDNKQSSGTLQQILNYLFELLPDELNRNLQAAYRTWCSLNLKFVRTSDYATYAPLFDEFDDLFISKHAQMDQLLLNLYDKVSKRQ